MKFDCNPGKRKQKKIIARETWHRWFAWYPIEIEKGDCRWGEVVERKAKYIHGWFGGIWLWDYREAR